MSKYFIGTYTNWCKEYCDVPFFQRLGQIRDDASIIIVDNTAPDKCDYIDCLDALRGLYLSDSADLCYKFKRYDDHQFHYNVQDSALVIRDSFLERNEPYLLIIESDVIPPVGLLSRLDKKISALPDDWGILGCLYYDGFHDYTKSGVHETHHALSGCTVYKREVVERYPFRVSAENWAAFPDAWICYDVKKEGRFRIFNDHDIRCEHLHYQGPSRQSKPI